MILKKALQGSYFMKKTKQKIFSGAATALITPFEDGRIDYASLERLIEAQIEGGIDALLINGTTGESSTLSNEERQELIAFAAKRIGGRVPTLAGTGCNITQNALELSKFACEVGCDAVLVVTPYYNKANDAGLIEHYTKIADSINKPLIIYNVPSRTGINIPQSVYARLSEHENIVGVKEASSSISDLALLAASCSEKLAIYSGNDDMILPALSLGGDGVISVLSNVLPKEVHDICKLYFDGNIKESTALQLKLLPLIKALFSEVNPIPIKALMAHLGACREEYRLPLCRMSDEKRERLISIANNYFK